MAKYLVTGRLYTTQLHTHSKVFEADSAEAAEEMARNENPSDDDAEGWESVVTDPYVGYDGDVEFEVEALTSEPNGIDCPLSQASAVEGCQRC
jgi:hypothetical protein